MTTQGLAQFRPLTPAGGPSGSSTFSFLSRLEPAAQLTAFDLFVRSADAVDFSATRELARNVELDVEVRALLLQEPGAQTALAGRSDVTSAEVQALLRTGRSDVIEVLSANPMIPLQDCFLVKGLKVRTGVDVVRVLVAAGVEETTAEALADSWEGTVQELRDCGLELGPEEGR